MSTPVSKTKSSHISVSFLFYNYAEITQERRNRKMRERAYSSEGTRSERTASIFCCEKERPRASRRLRRRAAQTRKSADRDASTPVSKTKSSHISVGFLFYNYAEITLEKRNRKMRERAYSSEGTRSERTASIFCCEKERPRASRRLRRRAAQTRKSADRNALTSVSKEKTTNCCSVFGQGAAHG